MITILPRYWRRKGSAACTMPTALKTLMSYAERHSAGVLSAIFLTGSRAPWLRIRASRRPKREVAALTRALASCGSDASPVTISTLSFPYLFCSSVRAEAVRDVRTSLCCAGWERR